MKTITITREQFIDAVEAANEKFGAIGEKTKDRNPMAELMMQLQNTMFGCLLADVLFGEEEDK